MNKVTEEFRAFLLRQNLQLTHQREVIAAVFAKSKTHLSVEELYALVKKTDKSIGQVTIFRTLKLLAEAGIARTVNLGDKTVRFELNFGKEHHDHLICTSCGKVIEVLDQELEEIQDKLCKRFAFTPSHHRLDIFGKCKKCG